MATQSRTTKRATQRRPQRRGERPLDPVILKIAEKIAREYQPEKIILFGSHAWGIPGPDSDVDLLVVKESTKRRIEREGELRTLLFGNRFPAMDLLVYTPDELRQRLQLGDFFANELVDRGRVLYGK